ncbi:MAG: 50S ribosomal protein L29 [Methylophilaceae bacterium]|nr:50S ribosomal protein L29 [Methylophilaceae bacterium]
MKALELRSKTVDELNTELLEMRRAQFSMRMLQATQQLDKPDQVKKVRRDIARVRTVLAEKLKLA